MVSGELEARCYSRGNHNSVALELRSRPDETGPNSRALSLAVATAVVMMVHCSLPTGIYTRYIFI